jgi:hypothetical protein
MQNIINIRPQFTRLRNSGTGETEVETLGFDDTSITAISGRTKGFKIIKSMSTTPNSFKHSINHIPLYELHCGRCFHWAFYAQNMKCTEEQFECRIES